ELGMHVVGGVDQDSSALKTFMRNFPSSEAIAGSVRSSKVVSRCKELLQNENYPHLPKIIVSGPPCQGFSTAGSRDPKDLRNKVLIAVARAIAALKPDCALIENVSTVLSEKYDTRMKKLEEILTGSKYHVLRLVLDASEFGVPQKRKRAFFLITRKRLNENDVAARLRGYNLPAAKVEEVLSGLPTPAVRPDDYGDEIDYGCIPNHLAMQHSQRVIAKIANIEPGKGPMSYRKLHPTRQSNTLFSGHRAPPAHFREPRSITVREAARLQGFPDSFRIYGSFSNQMMQVTNAVPPPLAQAVLRVLLEATNLGTPQNAEPR
ncbi:MAG: DNA cytosine methyltransferase, partial [Nitrospira sp.]